MNTSDAHSTSAPALQSLRLADRLKLDACLHAVLRERRILVIHSPHAPVLEHHVGLLIERLQASGQVDLEHFSSVDSEGLLSRMNEALASLSVDEATRADNAPAHQRIWVVLDTHVRAPADVKLLIQLLRNFPGAGLNAILLLQAHQLPQYLLDAQGPRLLAWGIEAGPADLPVPAEGRAGTPPPSPASAAASSAPAQGGRHGDGRKPGPAKAAQQLGKMWRSVQRGSAQALGALAHAVRKRPAAGQNPAPSPSVQASGRTPALPAPAGTGDRSADQEPREDTDATAIPSAQEALAARAARAAAGAALHPTAWDGAQGSAGALKSARDGVLDTDELGLHQGGPSRAPHQTRPADQAPEPAATPLHAAQPEPTPPPPEPALPEQALRDLQWLGAQADEAHLLCHALYDDFAQAQASRRGKSHLAKARLVALRAGASGQLAYVVVTGPYRSLDRAQASLARHQLGPEVQITAVAVLKTQAPLNLAMASDGSTGPG